MQAFGTPLLPSPLRYQEVRPQTSTFRAGHLEESAPETRVCCKKSADEEETPKGTDNIRFPSVMVQHVAH